MRRVAFVAAACLTASPAWAQGGGALDRLAALDADGDGAITRSEAEAARAGLFARLDGDGDGFLTQAERSTVRNGMARRRLDGADANGDGRVSRAEAMAQPYLAFSRLDRDGDGIISAVELEAVRARRNGG